MEKFTHVQLLDLIGTCKVTSCDFRAALLVKSVLPASEVPIVELVDMMGRKLTLSDWVKLGVGPGRLYNVFGGPNFPVDLLYNGDKIRYNLGLRDDPDDVTTYRGFLLQDQLRFRLPLYQDADDV